jgi:hypothetical protein
VGTLVSPREIFSLAFCFIYEKIAFHFLKKESCMPKNQRVLPQPSPLPDVALAEMPHALALATATQLLHLLRILGVGPSVIATRLAVSRTPVSLWMAGKRAVPKKYAAAIATMAQEALRVAQAQTQHTLNSLDSIDHQQALLAAFRAPLALWVQEVVQEHQQLVRGLLACCAQVAEQAAHYKAHLQGEQPLTKEGRVELARSCQTMLRTLHGLTQRVTVPHEQSAAHASAPMGDASQDVVRP